MKIRRSVCFPKGILSLVIAMSLVLSPISARPARANPAFLFVAIGAFLFWTSATYSLMEDKSTKAGVPLWILLKYIPKENLLSLLAKLPDGFLKNLWLAVVREYRPGVYALWQKGDVNGDGVPDDKVKKPVFIGMPKKPTFLGMPKKKKPVFIGLSKQDNRGKPGIGLVLPGGYSPDKGGGKLAGGGQGGAHAAAGSGHGHPSNGPSGPTSPTMPSHSGGHSFGGIYYRSSQR